MGRLTEYFGRRQRPRTEGLYGLPEYAKRAIRAARTATVDPTKRAAHEARENITAFPGPLQTPDDPPGCSARMKAARKATRLLVAMKTSGETPELAKRFDAACRVLDPSDGGDLGEIIRAKVFDWQPAAEPTEADLQRTTVCQRIDGDMTIRTR